MNPRDLANYILSFDVNDEYHFTLSKINKITYIVYGLYLAIFKTPIFDSNIQAWKYGPVIPELYYNFKKYNNALNHSVECTDGNIQPSSAIQEVVKIVLEIFGKKTSSELIQWTHREGSAWSKVYKEDEKYTIIPMEYIQDEFSEFINRSGTSDE